MNSHGTIFLGLALTAAVAAHTTSAQSPPSVGRLGECALVNGGVIPDCRVAYRTFGTLRGDSNNAVLVPTWLSGKTADWIALLGPGQLLDTTQYFVVLAGALANGESSSPSTVTGAFPQLTIEDMVHSQYRLAREILGLERLRGVVGVSMGGIQTFEWALAYPDFVDRFVSIVGTPRAPRYERTWLRTVVRVIDAGEQYRIPQDSTWRMLAGIFTMTSSMQEALNRGRPELADSLMVADAEAFAKSVDLQDLATQTRAILAYDADRKVDRDPAEIRRRLGGRILVINSPDDRAVSAQPAFAFALRIGADTLAVRSECAHWVFSCEATSIGRAVVDFLGN